MAKSNSKRPRTEVPPPPPPPADDDDVAPEEEVTTLAPPTVPTVSKSSKRSAKPAPLRIQVVPLPADVLAAYPGPGTRAGDAASNEREEEEEDPAAVAAEQKAQRRRERAWARARAAAEAAEAARRAPVVKWVWLASRGRLHMTGRRLPIRFRSAAQHSPPTPSIPPTSRAGIRVEVGVAPTHSAYSEDAGGGGGQDATVGAALDFLEARFARLKRVQLRGGRR